MAIKDQCAKCKNFGTVNCTEQVEYNGKSCNSYVGKINLVKQPLPDIAVETRSETVSPPKDTTIHGWLGLFLFAIMLGGLISAIYPIFTFNIDDYAGNYILASSGIISGIMFLALACYTLYAFVQRKPDAIFLAKVYVIASFISNLFMLIGGNLDDNGLGSLRQTISSLLWGIIWFLYLCLSKQVNELIPKGYRKTKTLDYYIIAAFVIVPIALIGIGIGSVKSSYSSQETGFIQSVDLKDNEYTDGKIIFTRPENFTCERHDIEEPTITIFNLNNEDIVSITLCSDYDSDVSSKNFNSYWENWKDEDINDVNSSEVVNEKRTVNGNPYFYKVIRYEFETPIMWRFILLFNESLGKVCVLSCYDNGDNSYLEGLLQSIRFQ